MKTTATALALFLFCIHATAQQPLMGPDGVPINGELVPTVVQPPFVNTPAGTWFYDGFENGNFDQWTNQIGSYTRTAVTTDPASGIYCFEQIGGVQSHLDGVSHSFAPGNPVNVSFNVKYSGPTNVNGGYFVIGPTTIQPLNSIAFFYISEFGTLRMFDGDTSDVQTAYTPNQWYNIEFRDIDYLDKTFDYFVDGAELRTNFPFRNPVITDAAVVHLYNFNNSTAWYDDITISSYSVGQKELKVSKLLAFPNPTTGSFRVAGVGEVTVYDVLGNELLTDNGNSTIDLSTWPEGIYIVKLQQSDEVSIERLVVKR